MFIGASTRSSKRGRKKSKVPVVKSKVENEPSTNVSTDAMQTTNDDSEKVESIPETKVRLSFQSSSQLLIQYFLE